MLLILWLHISECLLSKHNGHLSAPILIFGNRNSRGLKAGKYGGWLNCATPSLAKNCWTIAAVCRYALSWRRKNFRFLHISGLTWAIRLHSQKLGTWHSLFYLQVHIRDELHTFAVKKQNKYSLPLIFEIKIFWRVACSDRTIWNFGALSPDHMQNTSSRHQ